MNEPRNFADRPNRQHDLRQNGRTRAKLWPLATVNSNLFRRMSEAHPILQTHYMQSATLIEGATIRINSLQRQQTAADQ